MSRPARRSSRIRRLVPPLVLGLWSTFPPVATARALAVVGCAFYSTGGVLALLVAANNPGLAHRGVIADVGAAAIVGGSWVAGNAGRLSARTRLLMNVAGTALVLAMVLLAGRTSDAEALFWLFCFTPVDSFMFFPWRAAIPLLAWGTAASGIAAFANGILSPVEWAGVVLVTWVLALVTGVVVRAAAEALWDPVTGMLDRKGFDLALRDRCAAAELTGRGLGVAAMRLDTVPGRRLDDHVLQRIGADLRAIERDTAQAVWAHLGHGEFALITPSCVAAEQLLESAAGRLRAYGRTASAGVCDRQPGEGPADTWHRAARQRACGR
ncbi:MAG: GGDEF domain-containing protein [Jatrophihabitans sp.]|uniref:GGDEF domain-containing protein n=1 Tax=Jatrophihabitans sp. TaxID=1932789 RepID=UPI003F807CD9